MNATNGPTDIHKRTALLIDHDDSFTYNIRSWLSDYFAVTVINHQQAARACSEHEFDLVVFSPGPKCPQNYPHSLKLLKTLSAKQATLGICLGMQMMAELEDGTVKPYSPPLHGKTSLLDTTIEIFNSIQVARYHSLYCEISEKFITLGKSENIPMWIKHQNKKWLGFQFHPESFMTEKSDQLAHYVYDWVGQ